MADSYVETVAGELADLALADEAASGDITIVDQIGDLLGASSQTLQEAYMTAVRVRRAEARARALLSDRATRGFIAPPPAPASRDASAPDTAPRPDPAGSGGPRRVTR